MNYWLMKSEPNAYSIDDLRATKTKIDHWDGVRNYQARNMMRDDMKKGDLAFFYHSNCNPPGIAGIVNIVKEGYPDFTAFDPQEPHYDPKSSPDKPRWYMVNIKFKRNLKRFIALAELRQNPLLRDMLLLRPGNRLSITPVTAAQWQAILAME